MFSPIVSLTIGLTLAVTVALFAVILALRIPCNNARLHADMPNDIISRSGSPGPSDKSYGSKEVEDSDDRNPDVIPDTNDAEDQLGFESRHQNIATIDQQSSNNPTSEGICKTNSPQNFSTSEMTLFSHNMGYCTLRNGIPIAATPASMQVTMAPHVYSKSITQCTLPRGANQAIWSGYAASEDAIARHMGQMAPMQLAQHPADLNTLTRSGSTLLSTVPPLGKTIVLQHITQSQRGRARMGVGAPAIHNIEPNCMSDDDTTAQTPLVYKKESTV